MTTKSSAVYGTAIAVGMMFGVTALAETWTGGSGTNLNWTTGENWSSTPNPPANPAPALITFDDTGTQLLGVTSSIVDTAWTLNAGLAFTNAANFHTVDLGGTTLTLNGGALSSGANSLVSSINPKNGNATFSNGTLAIGGATAADIDVANYTRITGSPITGSGVASLVINSGVTFNLRDVTVGLNNSAGGLTTGILDLRGSTPTQNTFSVAGNFRIGYQTWASSSIGTVYLNDSGGVITALQVGGNFDFYRGGLFLNSGAAVTIGSNVVPVGMSVGFNAGSNDYTSTATFAPTGAFTGYFAGKTVNIGWNVNGVGDAIGTLDLRNTQPTQSSFVAGTLNVGRSQDNVRTGTGYAYLNDVGGIIQNLQVKNLHFGGGVLQLNAGADVILGNGASDRGTLVVGRIGNAVFAPTGDFTAHLTSVTIGEGGSTADAAPAITGTLDLRGASMQAFNVSGIMTVGSLTGTTRTGRVYLPSGDVQVGGLTLGSTGSLLQLEGTEFTVTSSTFSIVAGASTYFDFSKPGTVLAVLGDRTSSGDGLFNTYASDGRFNWDQAAYPLNAPGGAGVGLADIDGQTYTVFSAVPVPEPRSLVLAVAGLALVGMMRRRLS